MFGLASIHEGIFPSIFTSGAAATTTSVRHRRLPHSAGQEGVVKTDLGVARWQRVCSEAVSRARWRGAYLNCSKQTRKSQKGPLRTVHPASRRLAGDGNRWRGVDGLYLS